MRTTAATLLRDTPLDGLDARVLLCHVTGWQRTHLITRADQEIASEHLLAFRVLEKRRHQGEPVAQLVGGREFFGRLFIVSPAVLIPRPDTELLVEKALAAIDASGKTACRVLDLGTGSGAIAITLAAERPTTHISACDVSAAALAVAKENAQALIPDASESRPGGTMNFHQGSWFDALKGNTARLPFDVIVSNPPYIAANDPHLEQGDLRFEPRGALTDGADGLNDLRQIISQSARWLADGGTLLVEHGYDQGQAVRILFEAAGYAAVHTARDLGGNERVTVGVTPEKLPPSA